MLFDQNRNCLIISDTYFLLLFDNFYDSTNKVNHDITRDFYLSRLLMTSLVDGMKSLVVLMTSLVNVMKPFIDFDDVTY